MRPTLEEQLRGLREILTTAVAPSVAGDYPRETLAGVVRSLEMLEARVGGVGTFLAWDNAETLALLQRIAALVDIDGPLEALAPTVDLAVLDAENERLRGVLARAVPRLAAAADDAHGADDAGRELAGLHAAVVAHLRERIARYPYASTGSLPTR